MWDLPEDAALKKLISATLTTAGKVLGSVCHGPAAFLNLASPDGTSILAGRRLTCFSDAEEAAIGTDKKVPFLVETELRKRGVFVEVAGVRAEHVIRDGNLISGQNPASSVATARAFISALREQSANSK